MKILYAIQGTGNGHLARATEIVPLLKKFGQTDVLVSGKSGDLQLPFPVKYRFYGLSFIFGKHGGVDLVKTVLKFRMIRFITDLIQLPVNQYDLIISDFEPVSAWACKLKGKSCIGLSHQNAVLHPEAPRPKIQSRIGRFILKHFAPCSVNYGFHFSKLDEQNFTPVIRSAIRKTKPRKKGYYTVYLPAFSNEEIEKVLSGFESIRWEVFSKHSKNSYQSGNLVFRPVSLEEFQKSFIHCKGILCTAGFETPAEALFMGKKLCVIPMKNQYEQACNAAFLARMGIPVLNSFSKDEMKLKTWIENPNVVRIEYPDITSDILQRIIKDS